VLGIPVADVEEPLVGRQRDAVGPLQSDRDERELAVAQTVDAAERELPLGLVRQSERRVGEVERAVGGVDEVVGGGRSWGR
jgi:hypothetical protein